MLDCIENYAFPSPYNHLFKCLVPCTGLHNINILLCISCTMYKVWFEPIYLEIQAHFLRSLIFNVWRQRQVSILYNIVRPEAPLTKFAKKAISQGCHPWHFFALHICKLEICHSYMHANFHGDSPKKKHTFFSWNFKAMFLCQTVQCTRW